MKNMNQNQNENGNSFWSSGASRTIISLAAGAVAGAVTALLLAPQSGAETRRAIASGAGKVKDTLTDTIQSGINRLSAQGSELEEDLLSNTNTGRKQTTAGTGRATTSGYGSNPTTGNTGGRGNI
jgi:gas vesicle protein